VCACKGVNCPFPDPAAYKQGDRWTCPQCGTTYRRSRPQRWWRNSQALARQWRRIGIRLDRVLSGLGSRWRSPPSGGGPDPARHMGAGAAAGQPELADAFAQWAQAQGVMTPQSGEERATVLLQAFIAGYRHAMAINAAELEIVKRAGYDVFRDRDARGLWGHVHGRPAPSVGVDVERGEPAGERLGDHSARLSGVMTSRWGRRCRRRPGAAGRLG
jgi:hypothetical protein